MRIFVLCVALLFGCAVVCEEEKQNPGFFRKDRTVLFSPFGRISGTVKAARIESQLGVQRLPMDVVQANIKNYSKPLTETSVGIIRTNDDARRILGLDVDQKLEKNVRTVSEPYYGGNIFLQDDSQRSKFGEIMFVMTRTDRIEKLENLDDIVTKDACDRFEAEGATHLITGIEYGGQCVLSLVKKGNGSDADRHDKEVFFLNLLKSEITELSHYDAKGNVLWNTFHDSFIKLYCTTREIGDIPMDIYKAMKILKSETFLTADNFPLRMVLTPISSLPRCTKATTLKPQNMFSFYLEASNAMLSDVQISMSRLRTCMEGLTLQGSAINIKKSAMENFDAMQNVFYHLSAEINKIDFLNVTTAQFMKHETIYVGGINATDEFWNYKFWQSRVKHLCDTMNNFALLPDINDMVRFSRNGLVRLCRNIQVDGTIEVKHHSVRYLKSRQYQTTPCDTAFDNLAFDIRPVTDSQVDLFRFFYNANMESALKASTIEIVKTASDDYVTKKFSELSSNEYKPKTATYHYVEFYISDLWSSDAERIRIKVAKTMDICKVQLFWTSDCDWN